MDNLSGSHTNLPFESSLGGMGFALYCVIAWLVALSGSVALLALAMSGAGALDIGVALRAGSGKPGLVDIVGSVLLAPLAETCLLIGLLALLRRRLADTAAVAVSAIAWGLAHALFDPLRFFGSVWSFAVFGFGYMAWQRRRPDKAFLAAALPHALVNAAALLIQYLCGA
jgi:membrane protease YdiL (CAAX protease family)